MVPNHSLKISVILICISLHLFNEVGLLYSHPSVIKQFFALCGEEICKRETYAQTSFFIRIIGGLIGSYCFSKFADKNGFIKTMQIICIAYFCVGILLILVGQLSVSSSIMLLWLSQGLHTSLRFSAFILPTIYIFKFYKPHERYKYSALIWIAGFIGTAAINLGASIFVRAQHIDWCIVYIASSATSFILYKCIVEFPNIENKKIVKGIPIKSDLLVFLFAGVCSVGLVYQYHVESYVRDVMIVENSKPYSPFWVSLLIMLLPASQIAKNIGLINTIYLSLLGILLSVTLFYVFPLMSYYTFFAHQIIFAIFFSLFLAPSICFMYQILHECNSYFYLNFIFCTAFAVFYFLVIYLAKLKILSAPFLAPSIITLQMVISILILKRKNITSASDAIHITNQKKILSYLKRHLF